MDFADRKILENEISVSLGKAISQWYRKNGIEEPVIVNAAITKPSCYIDEQGISHSGPLITLTCQIVDDSDLDDDDY